MTATPGMFCPAIVTTYSGMARPSRLAPVRLGIVQATCGTSAPCGPPWRAASTATTTRVAANAAGTAHRRASRSITTQVSRIGPTDHGCAAKPRTGARHSSSTTPASIAWAIGVGIAAMRRPRGGHNPVITSSAPVTRKAPTAAGHPPCTAPVLASRAAPGVDQASVSGIRWRRTSHKMPTAWVAQTASSPEAASAGVAPTPRRPARTTAKELVNPTSAVRMPARTGLVTCSIYRTLVPWVLFTELFCLESFVVDDLARLVGERLRAARQEHGLSLGALAEAAHVGKGSLSEIENGVRNPTLGTLYALAGALGVPLATLIADRPGVRVASPGIEARLLDVSHDGGPDPGPGPGAGGGQTVEVYRLRLEPGRFHRSPAHGPGVVEHLPVTSGRARVGRLGEETE